MPRPHLDCKKLTFTASISLWVYSADQTPGWHQMHGADRHPHAHAEHSGWSVAWNNWYRESKDRNWLICQGFCDGIGLCSQSSWFLDACAPIFLSHPSKSSIAFLTPGPCALQHQFLLGGVSWHIPKRAWKVRMRMYL